MVKDAPDRLDAYARYPALDPGMKRAEANSPLLFVTPDDPPTLPIAGDNDKLVPIQHSRNIQAGFEKAKVKSQLIEVAGAGHGFQGDDARKSTEEMVKWFELQLAP